MKVPYYSLNPRAARSVALILRDKTAPLSSSNDFLSKYHPALAIAIQNLNAALAKITSEELTKEGKRLDSSFDKRFRKLNGVISLKAGDDDFGPAGESCDILKQSLEPFGEDIEELPREQQINVMDQIIETWGNEAMQEHIARGGVKKLFENTVEDHIGLKSVEELRASATVEGETVLSTWEARNESLPVIRAIFTHISDYAAVDGDTYGFLLKEIEAELKPVIAQVHAEQTRKSAE